MSCTVTFTPATIDNVQSSWSTIKKKVGENEDLTVSMLIFQNFFQDYPSTIRYFKDFGSDAQTILKQERFKQHARTRVFGNIDKIIGVLDRPEELREMNQWLVKIHKPKRIEREDFTNLGKTIVKTVVQALGDGGTEVEDAWSTFMVAFMGGLAESSK